MDRRTTTAAFGEDEEVLERRKKGRRELFHMVLKWSV